MELDMVADMEEDKVDENNFFKRLTRWSTWHAF